MILFQDMQEAYLAKECGELVCGEVFTCKSQPGRVWYLGDDGKIVRSDDDEALLESEVSP